MVERRRRRTRRQVASGLAMACFLNAVLATAILGFPDLDELAGLIGIVVGATALEAGAVTLWERAG